MKLEETHHSFYCTDNNCYVGNMNGENHGRKEYDDWEGFRDRWLGLGYDKLGIDTDRYLCFRFDIEQKRNEEGELVDGFELWLFFIFQRQGNFVPVWIKNIKTCDMLEIEIFLRNQWKYMRGQWKEVDEQCLDSITTIEEIQQYRAIGTAEECREARRKMRPVKPIKVLAVSEREIYECRNCGNELYTWEIDGGYCHWCGQKSEEVNEKFDSK